MKTGEKIGMWSGVIFVVAIFAILFSIGFFGEAEGSTGFPGGGQPSTSGATDSTDWIDLIQYDYPDKVFWQLDLISCNSTGDCSLLVQVETSCWEDLTTRNASDNLKMAFFEGGDWRDTVFTAADDDTSATFIFQLPREAWVKEGDSTYVLVPSPGLCRYVRLFFTSWPTATPPIWTLRESSLFTN